MNASEFYVAYRAFYEYVKRKFPERFTRFKPIRPSVVRDALVSLGASEAAAVRAAPESGSIAPAVDLFYRLRQATATAMTTHVTNIWNLSVKYRHSRRIK